MLAEYFTGVPARAEALSWWQRPLLRKQLRAYSTSLDPGRVKHWFSHQILKRLAASTGSSSIAIDLAHRAEGWFDRQAARRLNIVRPEIVVCYENAALETFRAARQRGIVTVLDAASFHHCWQDRFYKFLERPEVHNRIILRKDAEIELADRILTVSELARQSYVESVCEKKQIAAMPIGANTAQFTPCRKQARPDVPLRFVCLSGASAIKGWDVLQSSFKQFNRKRAEVQLTVFGCHRNFIGKDLAGTVSCRERASHEELARQLPSFDVLILPSRFDSFGMVVAEAMACGLPVIVSENVGAREMVIPYANGLVVPVADAGALARAIKWFLENRQRLPEMSKAARRKAEEYDWTHYRRRVVDFFCGLQKRGTLLTS